MSLTKDTNELLWSEAYRPRTVQECILPDTLKETFQEMVDKGSLQHLLLTGGSGTGKTTVARALCDELGIEYLFINGSEQNGIDVLRTDIRNFASTVSAESPFKVVILDEGDYLSSAMQPALRGAMQEFGTNCIFIFTCNFKNKILPQLHSRCTVVEFKTSREDRAKMAGQFFKRCKAILANEGIEFEQAVLAKLIETYFPDFRRALNEMQRWCQDGKLSLGALAKTSTEVFGELFAALKAKDYTRVRTWITENADIESHVIIRALFDGLLDRVKEVPQMILILNEAQKAAPWVADMELHMSATCLELMATCTFKE